MPSNKNKAVKGVAWSAIERFSVQGVQFLVSIVLARMLTPSDFGLIAIVLVFSVIFQTINESGFNTALIHKQDRDELDYSTAFVTNFVIGVTSYLILFFVAPLIADFYENKDLVPVMRILSLNLVINAMGLVPVAIYTIRVDFKTQAKASLSAAIVSGIVGISFAYFFHNVYAIVAQQISYSSIYVVLMWIFAKYKLSVAFSKERFSALFGYASKLIGARLISVVFEDIYSLAIGKLYTPASLGCYNRAQSFQQVLSKNIINIVQRVSVPMLCEQQHDHKQMQNVLLRFMSTTALIVYPMLAGLMVLSKPLVLTLLGNQWIFASDMLIYACPVGFFYLISTFNRNIYNATGRTDFALKAEIIKKTIFIGVFLLTMRYKIEILLLGLIVIAVIEMNIDAAYSYKQIGITLLSQIKSLSGIIIATLFMSLMVFVTITSIHNCIAQCIVGFLVGAIVYLLICLIFNVCNLRDELHNTIVTKKH